LPSAEGEPIPEVVNSQVLINHNILDHVWINNLVKHL
jgi:hypothetical protein